MEIWARLTFQTVVSGKILTETIDVEKSNIDSIMRQHKLYGWDLVGYHHIGRVVTPYVSPGGYTLVNDNGFDMFI